jgi:hypothetical protein
MSHGSVSFQEGDGALILDSRKLTLFADISFLKPQDIDRQAGDAVGFDAPKVCLTRKSATISASAAGTPAFM